MEWERLVGRAAELHQIDGSSRDHEAFCVRFKDKQIDRSLRAEEGRHLLDPIYTETRGQIIDYQDLANVRYRLEALVGAAPDVSRKAIDDIDALELKPNFFGLGINLNHIIKRVAGSARRGRPKD